MLRREGMRKSRERSTGKLRQNEVYWGLERQGVVGPSVCDTSCTSVTDRYPSADSGHAALAVVPVDVAFPPMFCLSLVLPVICRIWFLTVSV